MTKKTKKLKIGHEKNQSAVASHCSVTKTIQFCRPINYLQIEPIFRDFGPTGTEGRAKHSSQKPKSVTLVWDVSARAVSRTNDVITCHKVPNFEALDLVNKMAYNTCHFTLTGPEIWRPRSVSTRLT